MPTDRDTPRPETDVQSRFETLKRQQEMRLADWRKPRGACWSGFDEVNPPLVRTDAELMAAAEHEAAAHRAWRDAPEQVADRARCASLEAEQLAVNALFYPEIAGSVNEAMRGPVAVYQLGEAA